MGSRGNTNLSPILIASSVRVVFISGQNQREHFSFLSNFIHKIDKLCDFSASLFVVWRACGALFATSDSIESLTNQTVTHQYNIKSQTIGKMYI